MRPEHFLFAAVPVVQAAVLPLDAALCAEISKSREGSETAVPCAEPDFVPKSNRAKYCPDCAARVRRKKEAERQRQRYWQPPVK